MNKGLFFLKCVVLGLLAIAVFGLVTMYLWNWLVPALFSGPVITFWQAMGLLVLSKLLFWGMGGKGYKSNCDCYPNQLQRHEWKKHFYEKFSSMSPEERDAIKEKMKEKWCSWEKKKSDESAGTTNV